MSVLDWVLVLGGLWVLVAVAFGWAVGRTLRDRDYYLDREPPVPPLEES